jgi:hypothetical protein
MKFVSTSDALNLLPFDITRQYLYHLIKSGELKSGHHYIDIRSPDSKRPTYRLSVERLLEYFSIDPAKR